MDNEGDAWPRREQNLYTSKNGLQMADMANGTFPASPRFHARHPGQQSVANAAQKASILNLTQRTAKPLSSQEFPREDRGFPNRTLPRDHALYARYQELSIADHRVSDRSRKRRLRRRLRAKSAIPSTDRETPIPSSYPDRTQRHAQKPLNLRDWKA